MPSMTGVLLGPGPLATAVTNPYSSSYLWKNGDYCTYNGRIYKFIGEDLSAGEVWTPAHWTAIKLTDEFDNKIDKDQGAANAGKALGINDQGMVVPVPFSGEDFTGATSSEAGTHGYVPAPSSGDQDKFLKGDGTWDNVPNPQVMTGATPSTGGASGLVPASQAGDQLKVLTASGTWQVSPGAKLVTVEMTALVNESGSYSEVTYDERITPDMKPVMVEISNDYAFRDTIYIVPGNGQATLNCAKVSGSSTVTVTFQKVISDPTAVTSTEFDILNNRLMAVENVCTKHNVTITTTDWSSTAPYTYEWENSLINAACSVKVFVTDGAEDAEIEGIGYTQAVGKVIFTTDELPVDDLPLLVEITNAKAEAFQQLSAEEISSEAITGCDNVEEALGSLDEQIGTLNSNKQAKLKTGSFICYPEANTSINIKNNYQGTLPTTQNVAFVVTQCSSNNNCQVTFHWDVDNSASSALYVVSNVTQTIWVRWFSL